MHLAQVNVARMRASLDDPVMAGYVDELAPLGALAESTSGFVWLGGPSVQDALAVNVSVWVDYPSMHAFVYRSAHGGLLARKNRWFLPLDGPSTALWWVPPGTEPSTAEGLQRWERLRSLGPTREAFDQRRRFNAVGAHEGQWSTVRGLGR